MKGTLFSCKISISHCRIDRPKIKSFADCPQQNNSFDCGIYLLLFANFLAVNLPINDAIGVSFDDCAWDDIISRMNVSITEEQATSFREIMYTEILSHTKVCAT